MFGQSLRREGGAILVSILFLGLGFLAVWFSRQFLAPIGDVPFVSLLLIPIIVYLIVSGRLKELRAGEIAATFKDIAEQSVDVASRPLTDASLVGDMAHAADIVEKEDIGELTRRILGLNESNPIILTLTLGEKSYSLTMLLRYMQTLSQFRRFKFVVIQDRNKKLVAYMPAPTMQAIPEKSALAHEFLRMIGEGNTRGLTRYPGVVSRTITTKTTNINALREMTAQDLEALVVTEDQVLKGVVEREQILSRLVLAMAG